ncbi:MAG TPA: hypothetical protein VN364_07710 [Bellilinea sp.]|nr:hypothetical protein [Bellilinea sp.]
MIPDSERPQPETLPEASPAAGIDLRIQPGQRYELSVQARPGRVAVGWSDSRLEQAVTWVSLLLAAVVLLWGLARYPAQVTPEEVYPSLRAEEMIENDFKGRDGALLPAFLPGSTPFGIGTSAYLQVLPQLLRPNTLLWIRACNAILALLAGLLLANWMRFGLRSRYFWLLPLLLAGIPAWFTFTRSGQDIALAASLLTGALASYGMYRSGRDRWIFAAVGLAWLGFYAHPAARLAVPVAVLLLIAVDWRYHASRRRLLAQALVFAGLLALPLAVFLLRHPVGIGQELATGGSFLVSEMGGWQKAGKFLLAVLQTVNPFQWLLVDPNLAPAYRTGPYPPLPFLLFPLVALGGWIAVTRSRQAEYRLLGVGLIAAAIGAAPWGGRLPGSLLAVPILAVLAVIGLQAALEWLRKHWQRLPDGVLNLLALAVVGGGSLALLISALNPGPRWQVDYGREGLQYGAPQIYAAASEYLDRHAERKVQVWPEWSSDPDALRRFFAPDLGEHIKSGMVDAYLHQRLPDLEQFAFILPNDQYQTVLASGKFDVTTVDSIAYPDGQPACHLVELVYTSQFEAILAKETEQRKALVSSEAVVGGETIIVLHSALDIGVPANLFDGFAESLVRSASANPLVVELHFAAPRRLQGVTLELGAEPITVTAVVTPAEEGMPLTFTRNAAASRGVKQAQLDFGGRLLVQTLRLEVLDESVGDPAHVHLWKIRLHE